MIQKLIYKYKIIDELIVIDGGSMDKTKEICNEFNEVLFYDQNNILKNILYLSAAPSTKMRDQMSSTELLAITSCRHQREIYCIIR